jgi:three-Cys-motif partner protein
MESLPTLEDDGLATPDVGAWAEQKYQLVRYYADIFSRAMSKQWRLVYADIFAGAGHSMLRESRRVVPASPLLVLDLPTPFSKYVYSEIEDANATALAKRAERHAPGRDAVVLRGDTNGNISDIVGQIPQQSLTFCFADPFKLENLRFATVKTLADARRVDFLVLLASGMDANRNEPKYVKSSNDTVQQFSGALDWRDRWPHKSLNFGDFVADEFGQAMKRLGYQYEGLSATKVIRNSMNAPLYRLAFFSRHKLGMKFWYDSLKYTDPQTNLF